MDSETCNIEPPSKRRRTSSDIEASGSNQRTPSTVTRSEEFWLEDGTVVLQAETTQFLVHKSVLSRHSVVFSDMFAIPQSEDRHNEPSVEGKPLVPVFDTAEDIGHLLRLLYDRGCDPRRPFPFKALEVMLRLGNKYDMQQLVAEATGRLHVEFPRNLSDWDRRCDSYRRFTFRGIKEQKGLLFDIINLALEHEILSILPVAYFLCLTDMDALLTGEKRDDGSRAMLSTRAQQACILGRDKILRDIPKHGLRWMDPHECSEDCEQMQRAVCSRVLAYAAVVFWKSGIRASDAFLRREEIDDKLIGSGGDLEDLCSICREKSETIHSTGRFKMWAKLPSYFNLGNWRELEKVDPQIIVDD